MNKPSANCGCQCCDHRERPSPDTRQERLERAWKTLLEAIKHGDETHQEWLRSAIDKHFRHILEGK